MQSNGVKRRDTKSKLSDWMSSSSDLCSKITKGEDWPVAAAAAAALSLPWHLWPGPTVVEKVCQARWHMSEQREASPASV